jgi:TolB-like protein/Tfp pilus assembly protein PilF
MGEVWKARDTRLDRLVAIKCLRAPHGARFGQEARAIAALNHPHICQIFDIGPDYLVLEFVEGVPFEGPLPVRDALQVALQIASALEAAHKRGILHRDLKPANVLVTEAGAKLLDFGVATFTANADSEATGTLDGAVVGTASYMSPEQALGKTLDARSDVFSFGATLYEALSGRRAFSGDSLLDTLNAVVSREPEPLDSPLSSVVNRCLAKDASRRFQNVVELTQALTDAMGRLSTAAAVARPGLPVLIPSVAVLPFANMSGDSEQEYFSDGLTEEIINALARIPGLKVIARTSAFAFKGQNIDVRRIAETLGVAYVLEGSVRKSGNRVRMTAQLIAAADGSHLWSERYDAELADIFAVQDATATAIAGALQLKLAVGPRKHTPALPAYEEFLRARHHLQRWSPESARKAMEYLRRAIELDSAFALARCELGWCLFILVTENQIPPGEGARLMSVEARAALGVDPSLADAHAVLAMAAVLGHEWPQADHAFELALSNPPVQPLVRCLYSVWHLAPMERMREAEAQLVRSLEEDPLNMYARVMFGAQLFASGRSLEGETAARQALELDPNLWLAYLWRGSHHATHARLAEACADLERAYALAPWNVCVIGLLAGVLAVSGDRPRAEALLSGLGDGAAFGAPVGFTLYHGALEEIDLAAEWYARAVEQRDTRAPWILAHLLGERLTSSPRWPVLRRMMKLPVMM